MVRIVLDGVQPARVPDAVIAEIRARKRNGLVELLQLLGGQQRVELPKADVEAVSNTGRAE